MHGARCLRGRVVSTLHEMSVAAILLAAGASRRLGEPKQLLRFRSEPLLARTIRIATEAGTSPVIVVLGAHAEAIAKAIDLGAAVPVVNRHWEQGIASSVKAGLSALEACKVPARGALLMACDQPHLSAVHLRSLIHTFLEHGAARIVASAYAGISGTPAIFPPSTYHRLHALEGDKGARSILADSGAEIICVPLERGEIDIDLPADLAHLE